MEQENTMIPPDAKEFQSPTNIEKPPSEQPLMQEKQETGEQEPLSPIEAHRSWKDNFFIKNRAYMIPAGVTLAVSGFAVDVSRVLIAENVNMVRPSITYWTFGLINWEVSLVG